MPGPGSKDLLVWAVALAVGGAATGVAAAGGARLGAALTAGVIGLVAVILGGLGMEARR